MARAVGIVGGFRTQQEAVESLIGADGVDARRASGQHFVDVPLVRHIKDQLVGGGGKNPVQGDGQLDDAEVRAEMAAGF